MTTGGILIDADPDGDRTGGRITGTGPPPVRYALIGRGIDGAASVAGRLSSFAAGG